MIALFIFVIVVILWEGNRLKHIPKDLEPVNQTLLYQGTELIKEIYRTAEDAKNQIAPCEELHSKQLPKYQQHNKETMQMEIRRMKTDLKAVLSEIEHCKQQAKAFDSEFLEYIHCAEECISHQTVKEEKS